MFACEHEGVSPDFLCLAKGITAGYLPLAVTLTTQKVYDGFIFDVRDQKTFFHGHTYTANPLACSAAVTSLQLLKSSECQNFIKNLNEMHKKGIELLKLECPRVEKTRIIGTIAAFDIKNALHLIPSLKQCFFEQGMLLRPLGNTVYLLPPLS